jgi:hypothetical protein
MTKIKRFNDLNESFEPQKEEIEGKSYYKMSFKLKDVLPLVKLINFDVNEYQYDNSETIMYYISNDQYIKTVDVNGDSYKITELGTFMKNYFSPFGWIVFKNELPVYIVGIYEPHGESIDAKRKMVTFWGHEEIINLWLDDGEYTKLDTR